MSTLLRTKCSLLGAAVVCLASLVAGAHAQSSYPVARGTIPFAFQLGTRTLPPGDYTVHMMSSNIMSLTSGKQVAMAVVLRSDGDEQPGRARLIFVHQGTEYHLQQLWAPERDLHLDCFLRKPKKIHSRETAVLSSGVSLVEVAIVDLPR